MAAECRAAALSYDGVRVQLRPAVVGGRDSPGQRHDVGLFVYRSQPRRRH
jgi:hypothetical protein